MRATNTKNQWIGVRNNLKHPMWSIFHGKIHGFQFRFSPSDRQQGAVSILQGPGFHNVHALCVYVCVLHVCIYI